MKTIIAIHQPNFLPWLGYFYKIKSADVFCLLDDVQYSKNSYTNRCKVLAQGEEHWLTVPVRQKLGTLIKNVEIASDKWRVKALKTLAGNYGKSPFFNDVMCWLESEMIQFDKLSELNCALLRSLLKRLGLSTKIVLSSSLNINTQSDNRLVDIVKALNGNVYLSGSGGANYQAEEKFIASKIQLQYSNFVHPFYSQSRDDFAKGLSILDYLFNVGFENFTNNLNSLKKVSVHD